MRALVIDESSKVRAMEVIAYAVDHKEPLSALIRRMNKPEVYPGNDPGFVLELFDGFKIVYSIEQQPDPMGWVIHMSVSVNSTQGKLKWPHPSAVEHGILPLFGLKMDDVIYVYKEDIAPVGKDGIAAAVNMLFKYEQSK